MLIDEFNFMNIQVEISRAEAALQRIRTFLTKNPEYVDVADLDNVVEACDALVEAVEEHTKS